MTAVQAAFSEIQIIKSRSVMVLKCEVPLEVADKVLAALGGIPIPGEERWLALARIMPPDARPEPAEPHKDLARSMASKAAFAALDEGGKAVATAAILMTFAPFQRWLVETERADQMSATVAEAYILDCCQVTRKRDIPTTSGALEKFNAMRTSFDLWQRGYENA